MVAGDHTLVEGLVDLEGEVVEVGSETGAVTPEELRKVHPLWLLPLQPEHPHFPLSSTSQGIMDGSTVSIAWGLQRESSRGLRESGGEEEGRNSSSPLSPPSPSFYPFLPVETVPLLLGKPFRQLLISERTC